MSDTDKQTLVKAIDEVLNEIRPHLEVDGGNIEIVDITDDMQVQVKWMGNCVNCNMSTMTMRAGVEHTIKSKFPNITGVVAINGMNA